LTTAAELLGDQAALQGMAHKAQAFALQHQGATARTMALIAPLLS